MVVRYSVAFMNTFLHQATWAWLPLLRREGQHVYWADAIADFDMMFDGLRDKTAGMVHGRSDGRAAYPIDGAVSTQDLVTTIYRTRVWSASTPTPGRLLPASPVRASGGS